MLTWTDLACVFFDAHVYDCVYVFVDVYHQVFYYVNASVHRLGL